VFARQKPLSKIIDANVGKWIARKVAGLVARGMRRGSMFFVYWWPLIGLVVRKVCRKKIYYGIYGR
jgi:hypothetical protein